MTRRGHALSDWGREHEARGEARGETRGETRGRIREAVESILDVLGERGLPVSAEVLERIMCCGDLARLHQWRRAAFHVTSAEEIFKWTPSTGP